MAHFRISSSGSRGLTDEEFQSIVTELNTQYFRHTVLENSTFEIIHNEWGKTASGNPCPLISINLAYNDREELDVWNRISGHIGKKSQFQNGIREMVNFYKKENKGRAFKCGMNKAVNAFTRVGYSENYAFQRIFARIFDGTEIEGVRIQTSNIGPLNNTLSAKPS